MKIINYYLANSDLKKTMPSDLPKEITVENHSKWFNALINCDVWTQDGYLVTAVRQDGITHHLRKGMNVVIAELSKDDILKYKSDSRSIEFGL